MVATIPVVDNCNPLVLYWWRILQPPSNEASNLVLVSSVVDSLLRDSHKGILRKLSASDPISWSLQVAI